MQLFEGSRPWGGIYLGIAMRTALTKRGVAVVVIPGDVALRECSAPALSLGIDANSMGFGVM
jgi:thiamine pyrophosphate-dependent acetolactate synthase large subunit-like protein